LHGGTDEQLMSCRDHEIGSSKSHPHPCNALPTKASTRPHSILLTLSYSLRVKGHPYSTSNVALNTCTCAHGSLMGHPNWVGCAPPPLAPLASARRAITTAAAEASSKRLRNTHCRLRHRGGVAEFPRVGCEDVWCRAQWEAARHAARPPRLGRRRRRRAGPAMQRSLCDGVRILARCAASELRLTTGEAQACRPRQSARETQPLGPELLCAVLSAVALSAGAPGCNAVSCHTVGRSSSAECRGGRRGCRPPASLRTFSAGSDNSSSYSRKSTLCQNQRNGRFVEQRRASRGCGGYALYGRGKIPRVVYNLVAQVLVTGCWFVVIYIQENLIYYY
jgi:hypothetical protein